MEIVDDFSVVLNLFDFYWHKQQILTHTPQPAKTQPPSLAPAPEINSSSRHGLWRSFSDESSTTASSLNTTRPKLATVVSGQESTLEELVSSGAGGDSRIFERTPKRRRKRRGKSKSLSDLEFEELKGLLDLGFTFKESETDARLMRIVPGLQRLAKMMTLPDETPEIVAGEMVQVRRPYLSEAWDAAEAREVDELLRNLRVPADGDGEDLKDHIKFWARTVASTVK